MPNKPVKTYDEQYNDSGIFQYDKEGVTISFKEFEERINWNDITALHVFKEDLMTIDRICMEIIYNNKLITINEDMPGWSQFVLKTKAVFTSIPQDWDFTIIQPAFETNYTTIYSRDPAIT